MSHPTRSAATRCLIWILLTACCVALGAQAAEPSVPWPSVVTAVPKDPRIEARIGELLRHMTLEQKVAQMVQADIRSVTPEDVKTYRLGSILNGGGAFPGNDKHVAIAGWVALADRFYDASMDSSGGAQAVPVIWGTDAVHGHNNVVGATLFPHNVGLGAAHDPELIQRIGEATAREVAATGIDWTFAPTVAVVRDSRWGRSYEGYSERPEIVRSYAGRMIQGLQGVAGTSSFLDGNHVVATAKHFIGDGGTYQGIDRGDNLSSERELFDIHAPGYIAAIGAGVQTIMASYNSWQGLKMHGQRRLLTDVLKTRMGFDGLVVSDWDGIDEIQSCSKDRCAQAVNAGVDLFMVPDQWKSFIRNTVAQVRAGEIPVTRIDDAVSRILRVKLRAGLFEKGRPSSRPLAGRREVIGAPEHRAIAREAVRKSLVLLKNENGLLPLSGKMNVLVAGDGANDIGKQSGGWTISWQGTGNSNADFPGATSIFEGIRTAVGAAGGTATLSVDGSYESRPDVAIVVFGENPYAEWHGDIKSIEYHGETGDGPPVDMELPPPEASAFAAKGAPGAGNTVAPATAPTSTDPGRADLARTDAARTDPMRTDGRHGDQDIALLQRLHNAGIRVVAVFLTGRPRGVTPELDASNAFVVAWLPGTEGEGVADVLIRKSDGDVNFGFTGKLSYSWPRGARSDAALFAYGFGLTY